MLILRTALCKLGSSNVLVPAILVALSLFASPSHAICGNECEEAKRFCNEWDDQHPGQKCGTIRGAICPLKGGTWKKIKQVNWAWTACRLVHNDEDLAKAQQRCDLYEENWGEQCQVQYPRCKVNWAKLDRYGDFRACRKREISASLRYNIYKSFMRHYEGKADRTLPEEIRPFIEDNYDFNFDAIRFGNVEDVWRATCITDCEKVYCSEAEVPSLYGNGHSLRFEHMKGIDFHELAHVEQCAKKGGRKGYAEFWFSNLGESIWEATKTALRRDDRQRVAKAFHDKNPMEISAEAKAQQVYTSFKQEHWHREANCRVYSPDKSTVIYATPDRHPRLECDPEYNRPTYRKLINEGRKAAASMGEGVYHLAIGRPDLDAEYPGAWLGEANYVFDVQDASLGVSSGTGQCPKRIKIRVAVANQGTSTVKLRYQLQGKWYRWKTINTVANNLVDSSGAGYLQVAEFEPKVLLSPGKHPIKVEIEGYDSILSGEANVQCPPFEVTKAKYSFDVEGGNLCPRQVRSREVYLANGPGQFRKRYENQGGAPGQWQTHTIARDGDKYRLVIEHDQQAGPVDQKRRVSVAPKSGSAWSRNSKWRRLNVACLEIADADIIFSGDKSASCPYNSDVKVRVNANMASDLAYQLDCSNGQSLQGKATISATGPDTFVGVSSERLSVNASGNISCSLKADLGKGLRNQALRGESFQCLEGAQGFAIATPPNLNLRVEAKSTMMRNGQICPKDVLLYGEINAISAISGKAAFVGDAYLSAPQTFELDAGESKKMLLVRTLRWPSTVGSFAAPSASDGARQPLQSIRIRQGLNVVNQSNRIIASVAQREFVFRCAYPQLSPGLKNGRELRNPAQKPAAQVQGVERRLPAKQMRKATGIEPQNSQKR